MRIIKQTEYRVMPWKNGGGTTTEIHASPVGASAFDWRVSIASVDSDGPFSVFNGYQRHIMLLTGSGMTLDVAAHGRFELKVLMPFSFSGDAEVYGCLAQGRVVDFNLMVRREFGSGTLRFQQSTAACEIGADDSKHLVHMLGGDSVLLDLGERFTFPANIGLAICKIIAQSQPSQVV